MADANIPATPPTTTVPPGPKTSIPVRIKNSLLPANGGKWSTIQFGLRLGFVLMLTASVLGFSLLSGRPISDGQLWMLIMGGLGLVGISVVPRPGGGSNTGATLIGGAMLLLVTLFGTGCENGQQVPATQCTRAVLSAAADIAASCWPQNGGDPGSSCPSDEGP